MPIITPIKMAYFLVRIKYADKCGPKFYIRVALPIATRYHRPDFLLSPNKIQMIIAFIKQIRKEVETPIIITVALEGENDLSARIEGIIKNSPAQKAGLQSEDVILEINNRKIKSRTDCNILLEEIYQRIKKQETIPVNLIIQRDKRIFEIDLAKYFSDTQPNLKVGMGQKPVGWFGLLIPDDVDFNVLEQIRNIVENKKLTNPIMLTSKIMFPFWKKAIRENPDLNFPTQIEILPVKNWYFGGNVNVAGLQTVDDQIYSVLKWQKKTNKKPGALFISATIFSSFGIDIKGDSVKKLEYTIGCPVYILRSLTGSY